ncbi:MAG: aromatic hydrocarbon degradation protein [Thiobacillus sp. 65-69]|nr:outer membrane protein transport protein [Thiobacillus sp.]ODU91009.1 MAG: aromatic hydrocarbon degradation protein [Thiobacillus sp. SCN 65-179]OJW37912.1 MAG: aromatic hydrocarbon degradation protein [Thiobacillus sp. 65-69]
MPLRTGRLAACLALAAYGSAAHAAGYALIEQNASGLGNAYAGQAASAQDASTIFFNPAGMTMLPDRQVVMAGHLIRPKAEFNGTVTPNIGGGNGGDAGGVAFVPNAYYAFRLTPDVHLGIGAFAPFGLKTDYDSTWVGRIHAVKSELKTINVNPSIAWKLNDVLSLGAGVSIQYIEATLSNATAPGLPPPVASVHGDDYGWGFNLGLLWKVSDSTRFGLAYRSKIDHTLEGDLKMNGVVAVTPVYADVTLPDSVSLSAFHRVNDRWDVMADVSWMGWSSFDLLNIVNGAGASIVPPTTENWDDSYRVALGANYRLNDRLTLRGGIAYDETPVSDQFRTARIPDEDRTWLAFGAQYRLSPSSLIDVGYAHLFVSDARIDETRGGLLLSGEYDSAVDILSVQLTHTF